MLTSAHNDDDVLRVQRSWRQVFMDTCAKHRANRLKGMSPLAPLVATRFRGPPSETPPGLPYSTLYGGGHPFPMKMAMPAPSWGMPPMMGPPGMALPRPVMPPLGMQPPTRMAQPPQGDLLGAPPATLPAPLQPSRAHLRGGAQKGGCHLQ